MKNLPLLLIGGGVLFFLMSSKSSSKPIENNLKIDKVPPFKGAIISCSQFKITNKKEFKKSLQEISLFYYKNHTDYDDLTIINSVLEFISESCWKKFGDFVQSEDPGKELPENTKNILALLFGKIIQAYAEAIIPELEKKQIPWDKYLTEHVYSLQANYFLKRLDIQLYEYNDLAKKFDSILEYPFPESP